VWLQFQPMIVPSEFSQANITLKESPPAARRSISADAPVKKSEPELATAGRAASLMQAC
jgi:hypothetical protein